MAAVAWVWGLQQAVFIAVCFASFPVLELPNMAGDLIGFAGMK